MATRTQHIPPPVEHVRNIVPQGRLQKEQKMTREQLEKYRLKRRVEQFVRYGDEIDDPFLVKSDAVAFMEDSERFHTDTAGDERRRRDAELQKKKAAIESLRESNVEREQRRQREMQQEQEKQEVYLKTLQTTSLKAKRNQESVPYNPITLEYRDSDDGARLKFADDCAVYRAQVRQNLLQTRSNGTYNPITGAEIVPLVQPAKPATPQFTSHKFQ